MYRDSQVSSVNIRAQTSQIKRRRFTPPLRPKCLLKGKYVAIKDEDIYILYLYVEV